MGLVIFFAFTILVIEQRSWYWFVGLFSVAILNRESGEFIAVWMILDPLVRRLLAGRERPRLNWKMLLAGICCLFGGVLVVEMLRARLMIAETGPTLFPDAAGHSARQVFLQMHTNLAAIRASLSSGRHGFEAPMLFIPAAVICVGIKLARSNPRRWLALSIVSLLNLIAIFLVGVVFETRVYLELLPFILLGILGEHFPRPSSALDDRKLAARTAADVSADPIGVSNCG